MDRARPRHRSPGRMVARAAARRAGGAHLLARRAGAARRPRAATAPTRHDPDMYIEDFRAVELDAEGAVRQSLAAKRAEHHSGDDSADFTAPSLALTDPAKPAMSVTRRHGNVVGRSRDRHLPRQRARDARRAAGRHRKRRQRPEGTGNAVDGVSARRAEEGTGRHRRPVTIEEPRGIIHAVGMTVDNKAQTLKLKSGVQRYAISREIDPQ